MLPRLVVSLALAFLVAPPLRSAQPAPSTIRVMTYNIHHGEGLDQKVDLERIAQLITEQRADIVALQEVDRGCERTAKRDLPAEFAQLTGLKVVFEKNIAYQGGDYGNAVLTRFPVKQAKNTPLKSVAHGEQRGVLQLVLDVHGRDVLFLNTHLDARRAPTEREQSADELKEIVLGAGQFPVIACGDFNANPKTKVYAKLAAFLTDSWTVVGQGNGFTIPVKKPANRIDYVWISQDTVAPVKMEVLYSEASDHLPALAEVRLK